MSSLSYYENVCFVIMPFGQKPVDGKTVDFNAIYEKIFKPAIAAAKDPTGKNLEPRRTDHDAFSGSINQDMFEYIMYSRMALADISGLNANALYELGARHALQDAGTVILRQKGHGIPFDIRTIKVFEYDNLDDNAIAESQDFITKVLSNSLERNRLDSPIRQALGRQWDQSHTPDKASNSGAIPQANPSSVSAQSGLNVEALMQKAQLAMKNREWTVARTIYQVILMTDFDNLLARMKLGLVLKSEGALMDAYGEFSLLTKLYPEYGEAWREKGFIESLLIRDMTPKNRANWSDYAVSSFDQATTLLPSDADAWSSWGGLLRRIGREADALEKYQKASQISQGHPYPLLNAIKLEAKLSGAKKLSFDKDLMRSARDIREAQTLQTPPEDVPWSFFGLAEMKLYSGDQKGFLDTLSEGLTHASQDWMIETFYDGLVQTLVKPGIDIPGLADGLKLLDDEKAKRAQVN
ncbi:MAG: hypothetical protein AAF557_08260 [Pseudomonadota bacterium]